MASRQFSFFATYPLSFFSGAMYRDLARNGRGYAFGYLALLVAVLTTLSWSGLWATSVTELDAQVEAITAQIPDLRFADGRLVTPEERPYEIRTGDTVHAVIDTTGQYGPKDTATIPIVVTATEFSSAGGGTSPLADVFAGRDTITQADATAFGHALVRIVLWVLLPVGIAALILYRVLQALLFSLAGLLADAAFGCGLGYPAVLRVTVVALTPALVIDAVVAALWTWSDAWNVVFVILGLCYVAFAFGAIGPEEEPPPLPDES